MIPDPFNATSLTLAYLTKPIEDLEPEVLLKWANQIRKEGGKNEAVSEMLERAASFLRSRDILFHKVDG